MINGEHFTYARGPFGPALLGLLLMGLMCLNAEEPSFKVLRDFKDGAQGWVYASARRAGVPEAAEMGGQPCIALPVDFPAPVQLYKERSRPGILGSVRIIRVKVFVPAAADGTEISLFVKNSDGLWFHSLYPGALKTGQWNICEFDLMAGMLPDGHHGRWEETTAQRMTAVGIQVYSRRTFQGRIGVARIEGRAPGPADAELRIIDLELPRRPARVYTKYEITFNLNRDFGNPFDPEQIDIQAEFTDPEGEVLKVPAFFYREYARHWDAVSQEEILTPRGRGVWKLRFAPLQAGAHSMVIKAAAGEAHAASGVYSFKALPAETAGYVVADAEDSRYFARSNGDFFYPVGHNIRSPNDPRCANVLGIEVPPDRGTFAYDDFFDAMQANGENLVEIWMCSWWVGLEWLRAWAGFEGLGYYNLLNAWRLDYLLEQAAAHDIFIHLVIDNHGKLSVGADPEWDLSPYNRRNGGFLAHPNDFFTNEKARLLYKRRLRYILARWGWSPHIMGFELWSELNLVGKNVHKRQEVYAWHQEMANMIHAYPFVHLVTTHYSGDFSTVDPAMAQLKEIDYVVGDGYREQGIFTALAEKTGRRYRSFKKPGFITEFGGSWNGTTEDRLRADLHAGIWSAWFTDMAGVPLFWWFDFTARENLYFHYKAFNAYIKGEDKRGRELKPFKVQLHGAAAGKLSIMSAGDKQGGYVWIYSRDYMQEYPRDRTGAPEWDDISLTMSVSGTGPYEVEVWDTVEAKIIRIEDILTPERKLTVSLPAFRMDCALKIRPAVKTQVSAASETPGGAETESGRGTAP